MDTRHRPDACLYPPIGTRTACIGTTGSGKSWLAKRMLLHLRNWPILAIDPKGQFTFPATITNHSKGRIARTPDETARLLQQYQYVIYRPNRDHLSNPDSWEAVYALVFDRKNMCLYIDELPPTVRGAMNWPPSLASIFQQGRSVKITVIYCCQRPRHIPLFCFSEAERAAVFRLSLLKDRQVVAENTHPSLLEPVEGHVFWWFDREGGEPRKTLIKEEGGLAA